MSERIGLGSYVAGLPYQVGYALDARHVVAVALTDDGRPGPVAAAEWGREGYSDRDLAEHLAAHLARVARAADARRFVLVGYGANGEDRTELLSDALLATVDLPEPILVHVDEGTWRARVAGDRQWSPARALPSAAAEAVFAGAPEPATDRASLGKRFAPAAAATYAPLGDRERAQLDASPPSLRAEIASRMLDQLAAAGAVDDPSRLATLAYLAGRSDRVVRDSLLVAGSADEQRTEALVRLYRGAPEQDRPALATLAGGALFLRGAPTPAVEAVLRHADREGRDARLTELVERAVESNVNPHDLRRSLTGVDADLAKADQAWERARTASVRDASFAAAPGGAGSPSVAARVASVSSTTYGRGPER